MEETIRSQILRCELSDPEIAERALRMANLTADLDAARDAKSRSTKFHATRIEEIEIEQKALSKAIRERAEWRETETRDVPDFGHGVMETFRVDTGTRVNVRALTIDERQIHLDEVAERRRADEIDEAVEEAPEQTE